MEESYYWRIGLAVDLGRARLSARPSERAWDAARVLGERLVVPAASFSCGSVRFKKSDDRVSSSALEPNRGRAHRPFSLNELSWMSERERWDCSVGGKLSMGESGTVVPDLSGSSQTESSNGSMEDVQVRPGTAERERERERERGSKRP